MFKNFTTYLELKLKDPLPGFKAQQLMSPINRMGNEAYTTEIKNAKQAATMLLFFPDNNNVPHFVLTKRLEYRGVHSGQISLPGGKKEKEDVDFAQTAIRETKEEIGINPIDVKVISALSELYIPPSNFIVYPYLSVTHQTPTFVPQENEVYEIIEVPYYYLLDEQLRKEKKIKLSGSNFYVNAPYFDFFGHEVWGATAMMLAETAEILKGFKLE
jgi:8-oxo-dGTP pyrophosphatase MutT (NUDIX family)